MLGIFLPGHSVGWDSLPKILQMNTKCLDSKT